METEDLIDLPPSSNSGYKSENDNLHNSECEPSDTDSHPINCELKEDKLNEEISRTSEVDVGNGDSQIFMSADIDRDLIGCSSILQASIKLNETISVAEDVKCFSSGIQSENGCVTGQDGSPISNRKRDESPISYHEISDNSISGVKKARMIVDKQQPSVHVKYNSLTRDSKQELEELLQQWSKWHAQHCSSSHDSNEVLESGEETFFPALFVGLDNPSAVSFWMDNQTRNQMSEEFIALDRKSVPLYDRGYSLEGGLKVVDASRCFNCGSYNHSLKECPKPRDNVAVNNARKQHKSRCNKNAGSRNPTRYYQNSAGGKYDGLRPGVLDAETRKLLGLGIQKLRNRSSVQGLQYLLMREIRKKRKMMGKLGKSLRRSIPTCLGK
ncbi:zinc finger CCHC domain-containing protein 8-like isoform X3 [Camellia sinensis]|uniref:zinc finger CCHC domain-containing protein 8-like isoform X3 n=1 Tax=Camellia sinensis TaxID=4442 RepID=UPI001036538C|nr:zinc finger CCHC domain-containing protein 8-like isoform X3 [Camellia sinensis]